jgi:hypothetical protein
MCCAAADAAAAVMWLDSCNFRWIRAAFRVRSGTVA